MKEFFYATISTWWGITILVSVCVVVWLVLSTVLYRPFFKRFYDIVLSLVATIILSPLLLILTVVGAIAMKGNPFFVQKRPGKRKKLGKKECRQRGVAYGTYGEEKIIKLLKFRTMTNEKDADGNLLPDEKRLNAYGKFLRASSCDELPSILNILFGGISIVGPRPLLVRYLPLYSEEQRHRHDVRPGLTGLAQVNGRNAISWQDKFRYDLEYVRKITLWRDLAIIFKTVGKVFKRSGISQQGQATMEFFTGNKQYNILILSAGRRVELVNCFKAARDRLEISGKVYAADMSDTAPALQFADEKIIIPRIGAPDYIDALLKICNDNDIALIVPTIDTELEILAENKKRIEASTRAKVLVSDCESVSVCCDKHKTAEFFGAHGFGYPRVIAESDLKNKNYTFPLFIKPENGSSSINAFKVKNEKELQFFSEYIERPIVQECVQGTEYTVDCFSDFDGIIITVVPRIRLATRGGEILKGKIDRNQAIIEDVKKLIAAFGFIGQITVQCFLCDNGEIKYIEINPRFGGGAPMSISAGADSCENLYRLLRGEKLEYSENYEDGVIIARFDGSVRVSA